MRRHVLPNPDALDLDARALAAAAARRAGLSLEDWLAMALAGDEGGQRTAPGRTHRNPDNGLDSILARLSSASRQQPVRDYDTLMAAAAAESGRHAQDQASRTAIALESMAGWIEQAEERLNEASRTSLSHRDRLASTLTQALTVLKDRLDAVENRVVAERALPARIEFPVQEAAKALAPISETLVGLRTDMSRLAERLEQPGEALASAVEGIHGDIDSLRSALGSLATQEEIAALDQTLKDIAATVLRDLEQGRSNKNLLTLAGSVAALHQQVQSLSADMADGLHRRIGGEIELIRKRIDEAAETGVDRSVVEFLGSQIVDLRQDLARRVEPEQIERLSGAVAGLGRQIADIRMNQVGRDDFATLKASLEQVCTALSRTVASQEASDVPEQLQSLNHRLDILTRRPEPASLDPIAEQLALLTERMARLTDGRQDQADTLTETLDRLSSRMQAVADKEPPSHAPLLERFDRLEQELKHAAQRADSSNIHALLHSIEGKLEQAATRHPAFDALEQRIMSLADRFVQETGEPLKALSEAAAHLGKLGSETAGIAERAAREALKDIEPARPDAGDIDALKQGFVELKALHTRADKKAEQSLRALQDALETLVARFPGLPAPGAAAPAPRPETMPPADRLEAAVRRLHAATLSQIEEVSAPPAASRRAEPGRSPGATELPPALRPALPPSLPLALPLALPSSPFPTPSEEADLGTVRASFIAAARRATQAVADGAPPAAPAAPASREEPSSSPQTSAAAPSEDPATSLSLFERLRRTLDSHRRPLLFSLGFLILVAGTAQILSTQVGISPATAAVEEASRSTPVGNAGPRLAAAPVDVIKTSNVVAASALPAAAAKFLVDPQTIGPLPARTPQGLQQAALAGDAAALYEIAMRAAEGRGLERDPALAHRLFERAAQAGLPPAQERLAMLHEKGAGVSRDLKLAAVWYERAALGGNIRAMHNLATLLASSLNGKPDYSAALRWYGEAAEAGLRDSQHNMGVLLARGIGAKQDLPQAFKWFALAAKQGDGDAAKKRDEVAARIGPDDLTALKASVERWQPRTADPAANEVAPALGEQTASVQSADNQI